MSFALFLGAVAIAALACVAGYAYGIAVTKRILQGQTNDARENARSERRAYYQRVLEHLHANGTLPPNCDLKMPKATLTLFDPKGEIVAMDGVWKRLPLDNEILRVKHGSGGEDTELKTFLAMLSARIEKESQTTVPVTKEEYERYLQYIGEDKVREGNSALFKGRELVVVDSV